MRNTARPTLTLVALALAAGCSHRNPPATAQPPAPAAAAAEVQPDAAPTGPVIVELRGRSQVVTIHSSPDGPRYSIKTTGGRVLVAGATLDELRTRHPDLYKQIQPALVSEVESEGADWERLLDSSPTPWAGRAEADRE